ncbi:phospholipase D family protein [Ralstonia sp. 24A2]|uniref:phospholipase D family protein n=1 Tax=Ralstonia sp. 24A2 TaxID=3447364 RepID=UPI003F69E952
MDFRLVDSGWDLEIESALRAESSTIRIVCPFIKLKAVARIVGGGGCRKFQVITRFNLLDFAAGVSDFGALRLLLKHGAEIRGLRNLHAKLYIFGSKRAISTSANLTEAALLRNHEYGFVANDAAIISRCNEYFEELWGRSGGNLTSAQLDTWESMVEQRLVKGGHAGSRLALPDFGADGKVEPELTVHSPWAQEATQGFVKFFGESSNRALLSLAIRDEVRRSGCHWACTYPRNRRPRQVDDGALMFMGRLTKEPNDIVIYGRAIGLRHKPGRDDASDSEMERRPWKRAWPHYVRVHHAEFLAGDLANAISLGTLMSELGANAFASTQRNARTGSGNVDPRRAYSQQAAVELTSTAIEWLNERLECAFRDHGRLLPTDMDALDWPEH